MTIRSEFPISDLTLYVNCSPRLRLAIPLYPKLRLLGLVLSNVVKKLNIQIVLFILLDKEGDITINLLL